MPYIHVKSDERRAQEYRVACDFGANLDKAENREMVECITARTREAYNDLRRMEDKR